MYSVTVQIGGVAVREKGQKSYTGIKVTKMLTNNQNRS